MAHPRTRLPDVESERIINETLRRVHLGLTAGTAGGAGGGGGGSGTLESLTDVNIAAPATGDLIYRDGDKWVALNIPADWATQRYVLGIANGLPAWVKAAAGIVAAGWGYNWGNDWGGN